MEEANNKGLSADDLALNLTPEETAELRQSMNRCEKQQRRPIIAMCRGEGISLCGKSYKYFPWCGASRLKGVTHFKLMKSLSAVLAVSLLMSLHPSNWVVYTNSNQAESAGFI